MDEREDKRGAPKNQARRQQRSQRRNLARRSARKRKLRDRLTQAWLLPADPLALRSLFEANPWHLRRKALSAPLTPHEFGRVLVHLNQRRGAVGIVTDPENPDEGKVKDGMDRLDAMMKKREAKTVGQLLADLMDERRQKRDGVCWNEPIRNRQYRIAEDKQLFAGRELIRSEFRRIVKVQQSFTDSELAKLLAPKLIEKLDDQRQTDTWRHQGLLFGQRRTHRDTRTLGRCDLEPSERCIPKADMYAQEFLVLETVNNLRIKDTRGNLPLRDNQRNLVVEYLRRSLERKKKDGTTEPKKSANLTDIKKILGVGNRHPLDFTFEEKDPNRTINTDWFYREIVHCVFTEEQWKQMDFREHDSVNRAILKYDPNDAKDRQTLRCFAKKYWRLDSSQIDKLVGTEKWWAWKPDKKNKKERKEKEQCAPALASRPSPQERLNLSRRAIRNLLRYMWEGMGVTEARQYLAEYPDATDQTTGKLITMDQRVLYTFSVTPVLIDLLRRSLCADPNQVERLVEPLKDPSLAGEQKLESALKQLLRRRGTNAPARRYLRKHPEELLPPAPKLSNPVVRKAIHEVRRQLIAHMKAHRCKPDRIVIELARSARQSGKVRQAILDRNRTREQERKKIIEDYGLGSKTRNQQDAAVQRVLLCRQQQYICPYSGLIEKGKGTCPYSGKVITEQQAADSIDVEIDHIIPFSRCGDDSLNNKVLCYRTSNRTKGSQTPKEWLGGENSEAFQALEQRLRHIKDNSKSKKSAKYKGAKKESKSKETDYFSRKDYTRKWENLHRDPSPDEFRNSQLTDTAYAAKQVGDFLRGALYDGEADGIRHVFFTKGTFTDALRRDWRLFQHLPLFRTKKEGPSPEDPTEEKPLFRKKRDDHRHHAIDAAVTAVTTCPCPGRNGDDYLQALSDQFKWIEDQREESKQNGQDPPEGWPRRRPLPPPWSDVTQFRRIILSHVYSEFDVMDRRYKGEGTESGRPLTVSHRPWRRKIVEAFHEADQYGPVVGQLPSHRREKLKTLFSLKMPIYKSGDKRLKPKHLRVPKEWDELCTKLEDPNLSKAETRAFREQLRQLPDPPAGIPGIVRDRSLRDRIRKCLRAFEYVERDKEGNEKQRFHLNPDDFTRDQIRQAFQEGAIKHKSGVPIKSVILLRTKVVLVIIPRRIDPQTGRLTPDPDRDPKKDGVLKTDRVYIGGKNHHIEIRERTRKRKGHSVTNWIGTVITTYDVAKRNAARLQAIRDLLKSEGIQVRRRRRRDRREPEGIPMSTLPSDKRQHIREAIRAINREYPIVDRTDNDKGRFVMSLSIGEMIRMRHPTTKEPSYYVVFKIDPSGKIHFNHHWDARPSKPRKDTDGKEIPNTQREDVGGGIVPKNLRNLGDEAGKPPFKVYVSPLGEVRPLLHD